MKKDKTLIIVIIFGVLIISLLLIGIILLIGTDIKKKYPTFDEIKKLYYNNSESFNIANTYLMNQEPDENGVINYNLKKVEANKNNMTEEEYKALKTVFSQKIVDFYFRNTNDRLGHNSTGEFALKSNYKNTTISLCYIPEYDFNDCKHIDGNWYAYYYSPPNY